MAKIRIPSQSISKAQLPILSKDNIDLYWLRPDSIQVVDETKSFYQSYSPTSSGYITASSAKASVAGLAKVSDGIADGEIIIDSPLLGDVEDISGSLYKDAAGNTKVKYVIKVRNTGGAEGVDARIYNPYA